MVVNRDDAAVMRARAGAEDARRRGRAASPRSSRATSSASAAACRRAPATSAWRSRTTWRGWCARSRATSAANGARGEIVVQHLMPADALRVRGRHNAANALAALALASAIGCPLAPMLHALREYRGEPHRVEYVATIDGVDAFDDSKGTNVGATVAALDRPGRRARAGAGWSSSSAATARARTSRRSPRRWRATRARSLTIGRDAAAIEPRRRAGRRSVRALRDARGRGRAGAFARAQPRRRGAAQPGVRQPRHVPQLRAPRRGVRRRRCRRRWPTRRWKGARHEPDRCRRRARSRDSEARR